MGGAEGDGHRTYLYTEVPAHIVPKVTRARRRALGPQHLEAQGGHKTSPWVKLEVPLHVCLCARMLYPFLYVFSVWLLSM